MKSMRNTVGLLLAGLAMVGSARAGTIYYTSFQDQGAGGTPNVFARTWTYTGGTFSVGAAPFLSATLTGADGIVFAPDGNLLVGEQQAGTVAELKTSDLSTVAGPFGSAADPTGAFHLSVDTHRFTAGTALYVAGNYTGGSGNLGLMTLNALGTSLANNAVATTSGKLDSLEWTPGIGGGPPVVYYTVSGIDGTGGLTEFGTINTTTWARTQICGPIGALGSCNTVIPNIGVFPHGLTYDAFSNSLYLDGSNKVWQYSLASHSFVNSITLPIGTVMDQGESDQVGHLFLADNTSGRVLFVALGSSGLSGTGFYFTPLDGSVNNFLHASLDDLVVPSAAVPEPGYSAMLGFLLAGGGWLSRRRIRRSAK